LIWFTKVGFVSFVLVTSLIARPVIDSRKKGKQTSDVAGQPGQAQQPSASLFTEAKADKATTKTKSGRQRMSLEALQELEANMERDTLKSYRRLAELYPKISKEEVNDSEREWLLQAEKMIESFRETRQLFSTSTVRIGLYFTLFFCAYPPVM
jgi:general transcription factor 3C polypeptide 3 (transcription factor C subunit 4)